MLTVQDQVRGGGSLPYTWDEDNRWEVPKVLLGQFPQLVLRNTDPIEWTNPGQGLLRRQTNNYHLRSVENVPNYHDDTASGQDSKEGIEHGVVGSVWYHGGPERDWCADQVIDGWSGKQWCLEKEAKEAVKKYLLIDDVSGGLKT